MVSTTSTAYRRALGAPEVLRLATASLLARLPLGMGSIAIVLYVQHQTGSFGTAGAVAGAFTIGIGAGGPPQARLASRRGPGLLFPAALTSALALSMIVVLGNAGAASGVLIACAGVAGFASPPLGGVLRHRWPDIVDAANLPAVFAIDSILIEILFVAGPVLAGLLTTTVSPGAPLIFAAAVSGLGSAWLLAALGPGRRTEPPPETGLMGALRFPALRLLVLTGLPAGAVLGALDVTLPAFGVVHGNSALGGPLTAAIAVGSMVGGLSFGARPRAFRPPARGFLRLSILQFLTCLPLLLVANVPEMFIAAFVSGLCIAPLMNLRFELARADLHEGSHVEAFTWVVLSLTAGTSLGSALTGPPVQEWGWRAGSVAACLCVFLAAGLALLGSARLSPDRGR